MNKAVCISRSINTIAKDMNLSILFLQANSRADCLFNLGKVTSPRKEKLNLN